ncbi:AAT family amino acid transporter [Exophiala aquamarina CBS 119918]|uniref:AAT family amino acid transporter n=1 Tax=Exophiala aquamarina CBS 119918 TaxID=1182545 RepID=A0A072PQ00_9EURO|nr:AAT family amino acid transporter [Exophiala aquamarina CBS 119918]KEF62189.1 AAT family amino acid transporter [Exophiala aquamarina CBS 119918]
MSSSPVYSDPEKGVEPIKSYDGTGRKASLTVRKASVVESIVAADLLDERYATTQRGLKSRHAQMIALGGTIGTGLFVGSGSVLAKGGPAFILAAYCIMTFLVYCVVTAMTEVATYLPVHGGTMSYYGYRYVSRSLGFSLGYLYWYALGILVPYEITAAGLVINYWPNDVNIAVWMTIMTVVIVALNFMPVKYYGETEFWFAGTKVILMIGLLLLSFILFWGGGPSHDRLGFRYWKDPGAAHPFIKTGDAGRTISFFSTLVSSVFPFTFAPELLVVTGGEMESPRRNLPIASRRYFYRLVLFYVLAVLAIGVTCPSNDTRLTDGGAGAGSSAFVIAIADAGISTLPSIVNAVILISAWSSGNSFLYISSRALYSLAVQGSAPRMFKACNRWGVPYLAVAASSLFCGLTYLNVATSGAIVFNWFVNLTNTWGMTSWVCCMVIYLRFRKATDAQGVERPFKSFMQPYGAYIAAVMFTLLCLINGFTVFFPGRFSATNFLTAYIGIPIFFVMYFGHRIVFWRDKWAWSPEEVDLNTGLQEIIDAETPVKERKGFAKICYLIE